MGKYVPKEKPEPRLPQPPFEIPPEIPPMVGATRVPVTGRE